MNKKILGIIAASGLSLTAGAAFAQSSTAQQPPPTTMQNGARQTGTPQTGMQPQSGMNDNGMNSASGSGMNGNGMSGSGMQSATPPSFSTLDTQGNGFLTQQDAAQNSWLGSHWAQCDADHDGKVTRSEFDACSQQQ
ncbi:MAG TPA: hypothetical protein VN725_04135 [Rhodanobacteraceae bacterium]|nr:hypothetical protein [Rhodanobacteraceae bacterium]